MCYLVSSMPPATSTGLRQTQMNTFDVATADRSPLEEAQAFAAAQLIAGHTQVRLWKLVDEPMLTQAVQWPKLGDRA
jgi:hypothetical protein